MRVLKQVTLPRDTVYATVMSITTGVVGLCTMICGLGREPTRGFWRVYLELGRESA